MASASQVTAQVTRIGNGSDPAIYGSKVAWTDSGVIHVYDLTAKTDTTVNSSAASHPAIYGNKLVWYDESSGVPRLTVYDIPSGARSHITKDIDNRSIPAIYGNRIVWSANYNESNYNYNVYMRDISTSTQTKITEGNDPDIYDTKIAYGYEDSDGRTIAVYDINTNETVNVHSSSQVFSPHIYGSKVIWPDFYSRDGYIQMYDLVTKKTIDVTSDNTGNTLSIINEYGYDIVDAGDDTGTHIDINGDKIVYSKSGDDQFGYAGVYVYDIPSAKNTSVYIYPRGTYTTPDIYGNTIVWGINGNYGIANDNDNDNGIYMSDLSATNTLPPVAEFTANVTSGTVPLVVRFNDISTGGVATSWLWDFGDGIDSKHETNATHTFTKPGIYNVTLTVANEAGNNSVTKPGYITITAGSPTGKPVADFYSPEVEKVLNGTADHGIYENEVVSFFDSSTGSPTSWEWDFGDGNTSTQKNPTHVYGKMSVYGMGGYTVNLTVTNSAGGDTISKYGYVLIGGDEKTIPAHFSSNVTSGISPLTVLFHDTTYSEATGDFAYFRIWDFGDGTKVEAFSDEDKNDIYLYVTHTYKKPGKYTVTLMSHDPAGKSVITKYNYITVIDPNIPVANFNSNVTEGYAPLAVQFNDISQKATSRTWDFNGDGQPESSDLNPVYVYANPGTYTVNLTVNNENGTASKKTAINVLTPSSPGSGSNGGSSHSSSNGGSSGGAGGSPEPARNVQVKELSQAFITNGKTVKFDFAKNATCVVYVSFDSKKTFGKTTTIAEQLKGKSTLVSGLPSGEVYKSFNVWVGNGGVATSKNIENPVVCFKVEKAWIKDKKINQDSITLNRYSDKKWEQFPVNRSGEDNKYLYFTAKTSGFSSFAITGTAKPSSKETEKGLQLASTETTNKNSTENKEPQKEQNEILKTPGFEIYYGIASLLTVLLYKKK
ncbi:PGF-pre-PGF domain-containing protein [Methanosarcina sp. Z-7115]|uniref:PGF-pre-PGF domain-containing protein n=1 Tax=Methanosarcina baikalica TaxID=3073890 RepID=A0ABU2D3Q1_9EURY|nr:PGF-pre-PGF domain-containing protein [Methanosarcina sp. Z-7115]MDR7666599.1 PGF-pre-PGF domain-containing protein [Methanosarcina sp. Z-7115]